MAVTIKTEQEIEKMCIAGKYLGEVLEELVAALKPGKTTGELNALGEKLIRQHGCIPSFLHYNGYPASICISVNEEVVHGIPSKKRFINEGDLVSFDAGLIYQGYHSDACRSAIAGEGSEEYRQLIRATEDSFFAGISKAVAGNHLYDISNAVADAIEPYGYGIVEDLVGHGIGRHLHEDPEVPNFRQRSRGIRLRKNMTLAVEPMITLGTYKVITLDDDWTVVTADGKAAAHYENTILITDGEPEILTLPGGRRA